MKPDKIKTLFSREITRRIEEVIKVDQHDPESVRDEIKEYVATDSIKEHFYTIYDEVARYPADPHEGIGVWVSGFFGSGKSSFAKFIGYTLANRQVGAKTASEWFTATVQDSQITSYLQNINSRFPTHAVIFDISMDRSVRTASEKITEVMYKALLCELGYAEDFDLAALEIWLEVKGRLDEFIGKFNEIIGVPWQEERDMGMGIVEASTVLHELMPDLFPSPETWSNSFSQGGDFIGRADITPNVLARRAFELMERRKPGHGLVFIIDEVGQYVSRSVDKMLDLQGVVQAFGRESKNRVKAGKAPAPCWILVTSQEKLNEIVDAIGSRQIELARLQDRFPVTIDLKQSDIQEITGIRVLLKTDAARDTLGKLFDHTEGRLKTHCTLERTSRDTTLRRDEFINLYPYLPYQLDLCIDIVAGLRLKRGAQRHIGGSNRTIIKQAQQMLIHNQTRLAEQPIGTLVTLDKVYELLHAGNLLPSEVTHEVDDVAKRLPDNPMAFEVAKAIALLEAVKDLPRTAHNLAAVLHPAVDAESILLEVEDALKTLMSAQVVRESEDGYKLLTVQEKTWDNERAGHAPRPKHRNLIKEEIIREIFNDPKLRTFRYKGTTSFRIGLSLDGQKLEDGQIPVALHTVDNHDELDDKKTEVRSLSRDNTHKNEVHWVFSLTEEIHGFVTEVYRSKEMVGTYSRLRSQNQINAEESACLEDEKQRLDRIQKTLRSKLTEALESGSGFLRGVEKDASTLGNTLSAIMNTLLDTAVPEVYPKLEMGSVKLKGDEPGKLLTAANLTGLPEVVYDNNGAGLNLVTRQDNKLTLNPDAATAEEILGHIKREHAYGSRVTGKSIEATFQKAPFAWGRDLLRLVLAALLRAGTIEVTYQGRKYRSYSDPASHEPFTNNTAFKSASFAPRESVNLKTITDAATRYEDITGEQVEYEEDAISQGFKEIAEEDREILLTIKPLISAHHLPGGDMLDEFGGMVDTVLNAESDECVTMLAGEGMSYQSLRQQTVVLREVLTDTNLSIIRNARSVLDTIWPILEPLTSDESLQEHAAALKSSLESADFGSKIEQVRQAANAISEAYKAVYTDKHTQRADAYHKSIEFMKGHASFGLLSPDDQAAVLLPLTSRNCTDQTLATATCKNCSSSIAKMESDILALTQLRQEALRQIDERTAPEEKIVYVRLNEFMTGRLESENDIDAYLNKVREKLTKILAEGGKIVID